MAQEGAYRGRVDGVRDLAEDKGKRLEGKDHATSAIFPDDAADCHAPARSQCPLRVPGA